MIKSWRNILLGCSAAIMVAGGCVNQSQNQDSCTGSLDISFYSRSRCQNEVSYPGTVGDFIVCVFDRDDLLAAHRIIGEATLDADHVESFDLAEGLYTAVAWTGVDDNIFDISSLLDGTTRKSDLLLRLKRNGDSAVETEGAEVYQGSSSAFYINTDQTEDNTTSVNLLEVSNRISIFVEGLPDGGEGYEITLETDNGSMNIDGTIASDDVLVYEPVDVSKDGILASDFTLLKLETGHTYRIVITNTMDGSELYRGSLLGALILKNPEVDLLCDHDFTIRFTAEDQCECGTYMIAEIWVNNWLVHSYSTDF